MNYLGSFNANSTVRIFFTTHAADGSPVAPSSAFENSDVRIYKNGSATQRSTATGTTMTSPFDSVVGLHLFEIDTSDNTDAGFFAAGNEYTVVLVPDETVDSLAVTKVIGAFALVRADSLIAAVETDTQDIQSRLPAALVSGRMDASVGAMAANTMTATALASDAVTEIQSGLATTTHLQEVEDKVDTVDTVADAIKAKTDNLPASPAATGDIPSAAAIADAVWDEATSGHTTGGTFGEQLKTDVDAILADTNELQTDWTDGGRLDLIADAILVDTGTTLQGELDGIQADTEDIQSRLPAALVSGRMDASVGAMAANTMTASALASDAVTEIQSGLATTTHLQEVEDKLDIVDTNLDSALADTNELQTDWANGGRLDLILDARASQTSVDDIPTNAELATALDALPTAAENADAVWDEATSGHISAGTFGQRNAIIRANTAQAGASTTITLDASASAVDDFYNNTILVVTAGTGAGQSRIITDYVGSTKVATVSAWATNPSSDSVFVILPFGSIPGASAPTAAEIADAVWDEATSGHTSAGTFGEQLKTDVDAILEDTGTTLQGELDGIQADTEDIQSRLPAALVSGRMDASVGAMAANTLTASAVASDAVTEIQSGLATASALTTVAGNVTDILADTADMQPKLGTPAGASISADIADIEGKVDDLETRLGTPSDLGSGATIAGNLVDIEGQTDDIASLPTASGIADAVWDEATSGHTTGGTFGKLAADVLEDTGTTIPAATTAIETDTQDIQSRLPAALVGGRMDSNTQAMANNVVTAAAVASDAVTEIQSGLATTTHLQEVEDKLDIVDTVADGIATAVADIPTNAELATALAAADDAVLAAIAALNNPSAAQITTAVWAQAMSDLAAVPGATASVLAGINWLFEMSRNRIVQSSSTTTVYRDDGTTALAAAAVSDNGTNLERGEFA